MLSHNILTNLSRSGLVCSWKNPKACISSWVTWPLFLQPLPSDKSCFPPFLPMYDSQTLLGWIVTKYFLHHRVIFSNENVGRFLHFNSSNLREYIEQSRKMENQTAFSRRSLARKSTKAIKVLRYITDYMNREPIARKGKTTSKKYYTEWWITKQCLKFAPILLTCCLRRIRCNPFHLFAQRIWCKCA